MRLVDQFFGISSCWMSSWVHSWSWSNLDSFIASREQSLRLLLLLTTTFSCIHRVSLNILLIYYSHVYINLEELQGHDSHYFSIEDTVEWNNFSEDDVYELFHRVPEVIIFWKRLFDILNCSSRGCKEKLANESKVPDYDNTFIRSDIALAFFVDVWISSVSAILYQGLNV